MNNEVSVVRGVDWDGPRIPRARLLRRLQTLIGNARAAYENDRAPDRADRVLPALSEAFDIVVRLRSRDRP